MKTVWWRILAVLLVLIAASSEEVISRSCMKSGPPCEAAWSADAVFAGTVRSIEEVDDGQLGQPHRSMLVKFDVEHAFVNAAIGPIELITGGYSFVPGRRYLVYAWKTSSSRLRTDSCSRTRALEEAQEDLRYLTTLSEPGRGARVYGRITHWQRDPFEDRTVDYGPVPSLVVNLRGGAFSRDAATDDNGRYEFSGLPTGKLTLRLMVPAGFDPRYLEREFEIRDARACSEHDFQIRYVTQASGTVVDAAGRPLRGISVDAVAAELAGHRPPPYQQPVTTNEHGWFAFDELPPGSYVFGVNLTNTFGSQPSGPSVFFPGTSVARDATVVELKPGDRKEIGVLRLTDR